TTIDLPAPVSPVSTFIPGSSSSSSASISTRFSTRRRASTALLALGELLEALLGPGWRVELDRDEGRIAARRPRVLRRLRHRHDGAAGDFDRFELLATRALRAFRAALRRKRAQDLPRRVVPVGWHGRVFRCHEHAEARSRRALEAEPRVHRAAGPREI